jgi:hypothetical protein
MIHLPATTSVAKEAPVWLVGQRAPFCAQKGYGLCPIPRPLGFRSPDIPFVSLLGRRGAAMAGHDPAGDGLRVEAVDGGSSTSHG